MATFVSPKEAARMLDGFMIGAVMQQDPYLEEFGNLPEEPPDEDPCWDSQPKDALRLEQGTLFDLPEAVPQEPKAVHPTVSPKPTNTSTNPRQPDPDKPQPYVPRHITYAEFLKVFNGDTHLASYWFDKQNMKE